jgi:hypothetical protein
VNSTLITVLVFLVAAIAIGIFAFTLIKRKSTERLKKRFGPEYDRVLESHGNRRRAEKELLMRQKRIDSLNIHPLLPEDRSRFIEEWKGTQARFVDDPSGAVDLADKLVKRVMEARGYPLGDFEQRKADISVYHPRVVQNYRAAREIAKSNDREEASTEDLRQAMVFYRELFEDLLETTEPMPKVEKAKLAKPA